MGKNIHAQPFGFSDHKHASCIVHFFNRRWPVEDYYMLRQTIKDFNVKNGSLSVRIPETVSLDVKSSTILRVCHSVADLFSIQWLQSRFHPNIVTNFCLKLGCHIPQLIVSDRGETITWATQGMINIERGVTNAMRW